MKYHTWLLIVLLLLGNFVSAEEGSSAASVELKINGIHGVLNLPYGSSVVLSWNSSGVLTCKALTDSKTSLSGTQWKGNINTFGTETIVLTKRVYGIDPFVFIIECVKKDGRKIRDEVRVAADPLRFVYPIGGEVLTAGTDVLIRHYPVEIKGAGYRVKDETGSTYPLVGVYTHEGFLWQGARYLSGKKEKGLTPDGRYSLIIKTKTGGQTISKTSTFIANANPNMRKPEGLAVVGKNLVWTTISETWGYDIYRNTIPDSHISTKPCTSMRPYTSNGCYKTVGSSRGAASQISLSGLTKGATYYYKVRSRNQYGEVSDWSEWKTVAI